MKQLLVPLLFWALLFSAMAVTPYHPASLGEAGEDANNFAEGLGDMGAAFPLAFGGRILFETPCTCSGGLRLEVGSPRPMDLWYQPGVSVLFSFYNLLPPDYVLGTYTPGGACTVWVGPVCVPVPPLGTITIAGTSLTPLSPSI